MRTVVASLIVIAGAIGPVLLHAQDDIFSPRRDGTGSAYPSSVVQQTAYHGGEQCYADQPCYCDACQSPAPDKSVWTSWDNSSRRYSDCLGRLFGNDELFPAYSAWEFKPGDNRVLGDGQIVVPLWQTCDTLIFADIRGQLDDSENYEGNWGLAYRQIRDNGWIVGAYGFYDLRETENDNTFNQATFGVESMSVEWEARVNGYLPETSAHRVDRLNQAAIRSGTIVVRAGEERAYFGADAEIGRLLRDWNGGDMELRGFVGGFHFDNNASGFPNVSGPRARLEFRAYDLDMLGEGSRVTLGGEWQWDQVRDDQFFALLRVRIPLGRSNAARPLSRLERRMLDRIVRDVDIVAQAQAGSPELAVNPLTGRPFGQVQVVDSVNGSLQDAVNAAGTDGTVIADGSMGQFTPGNTITLENGQTLLGGGSALQVTGINTGAVATFNAPGIRPVINQMASDTDVINLADNTAVFGNTILGGEDGLVGNNVAGNIVIQNNIIETGSDGVLFEQDTDSMVNVQIRDNEFRNQGDEGVDFNLDDNAQVTAHIENNQFINVSDAGIEADVADNAVLDLSQSIVGNTFLGMNNTNSAVELNLAGDGDTNATILANIRNNTIMDVTDDGVFLDVDDSGTMTTTIANNQFLNIADDGVEVSVADHDDGNITQTTTIMNNQFTDVMNTGVRIEANDIDGDDQHLINQTTTISGNTFLRNGTGVAMDFSDADADADGEYVNNTMIMGNSFQDGTGDAINLDVSDWDDENLTINLGITGNMFMNHADDAIDLDVGDIDLDSDVVHFNPTIANNMFTGTTNDNIRINVADEVSLIGSVTGNTVTGGNDGFNLAIDAADGPNVFTIGGNSFDMVSDDGVDISIEDTTLNILDNGMNNTVTNFGDADFELDNDGGTLNGQILINGTPQP